MSISTLFRPFSTQNLDHRRIKITQNHLWVNMKKMSPPNTNISQTKKLQIQRKSRRRMRKSMSLILSWMSRKNPPNPKRMTRMNNRNVGYLFPIFVALYNLDQFSAHWRLQARTSEEDRQWRSVWTPKRGTVWTFKWTNETAWEVQTWPSNEARTWSSNGSDWWPIYLWRFLLGQIRRRWFCWKDS